MDILPLNTESKENELIELFRQLNREGQQIVIDCAVGIVASGRYKKPLPIPWATKRKASEGVTE